MVDLDGEKIMSDLIGVRDVMLVDSLIILTVAHDKHIFHVYSSRDYKYIGSFGIQGKGPRDFMGPRYANQFIKEDSGIKIWINDVTLNKFCLVNVSKSLEGSETIIEKQFQIPAHLMGVEYAFYVKEDKIIGVSDNGKGRMFIYNPIEQEVEYTPVFTQLIQPVSFGSKQILFKDICGLKPDNSRMVSLMHFFPQLDVFDVRGNVMQSIYFGEPDIKSFTDMNITNGKITNFYEDAFVTDKYIYVLRTDQMNVDVADKAKTIEVQTLNWEGAPIAQFNIRDYILQFVVDEQRGILYGLDFVNEALYAYDIKDQLISP